MFFRSLLSALLIVTGVAALSVPVSAEEDAVVAIVNGDKIYMSEVNEALSYLPQQYRDAPFEGLYPHLVNRLVIMRMAANEARAQGKDETDKFITKIEHAKNRLLEQIMLEEKITSAMSDERLNQAYAEFSEEKQSEFEVQARHILVETAEEAKGIIAELQGGADFAELAKARSTGPSGPEGGYLGYFGKGMMVPEFEQAAFALNAGEITQEPVMTQFGYHVILVEDKRQAFVPPLEDVAEELLKEIQQDIEAEFIDSLHQGAEIQTFKLDGSPADSAQP